MYYSHAVLFLFFANIIHVTTNTKINIFPSFYALVFSTILVTHMHTNIYSIQYFIYCLLALFIYIYVYVCVCARSAHTDNQKYIS